jgi:hypothetical protein
VARVQRGVRRAGGGRRGAGQAHGVRHLDRGVHDALADHHDGDGGAAHDIDRRVPLRARPGERQRIAADIAGDERGDAGGRDADQHDRLVVVHQARAADPAGGAQPHENLDRLAGVAGGFHPVGVDESIAEQPLARLHRSQRRAALRRLVAVGTGHQLRRRHFRQELGEAALRYRPRRPAEQQGESQQQPDPPGADMDGTWRFHFGAAASKRGVCSKPSGNG